MIQRSGLSARSLLPISAATARTCSTFVLSSVSGMVKNWGAWGSMAPPITVDIMGCSPCGPPAPTLRAGRIACENIAPDAGQQGDGTGRVSRPSERLRERGAGTQGFGLRALGPWVPGLQRTAREERALP